MTVNSSHIAQLEMKLHNQQQQIDRLSKAIERLSALATAISMNKKGKK
tara:strand:+ start:2386 stop:2529 length:144 start_codon:yes stop_codon:yes gene_type:complete